MVVLYSFVKLTFTAYLYIPYISYGTKLGNTKKNNKEAPISMNLTVQQGAGRT